MAARKKSQPLPDENFYSKLAADFDESEENSSVSDADVNALTKALADMDDMDDALFSSSLKQKKTPSKEPPSNENKSAKGSLRDTPSPGLSRTGTFSDDQDDDMFKTYDIEKKGSKAEEDKKSSSLSKTFPGRSKPKSSSFDFGEFDEDDPLAGLLSDDEDAPKPKKKPGNKTTRNPLQVNSPIEEHAVSSKKSEPKGSNQSKDNLLTEKDKNKTPTVSNSTKSKKADDIDFGDDDEGILDGLGFDDTPRDVPKLDKEQEAAKAKVSDLFGKTSILDKPPTSKGRTKEFQLDSKYKKQQTAPPAPKEEDFTFGGYTPSSVTSKRPDSAPPARRGVRFADEADDDDDIFGNSTMDRPRRTGLLSSSSSPTKQTASRSDDWLNEAVGLSGSKNKPEEKKQIPKADSLKQHGDVGRPSLQIDNVKSTGNEKKDKKIGLEGGKDGSKRSAADYLGLGGDEIDVDSIAPPKQLTPRGERLSKQESGDNLFGKPANRDATSPFPWENESPRRTGRRNTDLSSTGDLGSTFDSINYSDDDDDPLGNSDPLRASLIAQQIKQLADMEKREPSQKPGEGVPPVTSNSTITKPLTPVPTSQANQIEASSGKSHSSPVQRQSSTTSISGDHKQLISGRREPKWRQEMRQQQQQQSLNTSTLTTQQPLSSQPPSAVSTTPGAPAATVATTDRLKPETPVSVTTPSRDIGGGVSDIDVMTRLNQEQSQIEKQRESLLQYEATIKQQQIQMAAEHEKQMRLIQEQQQKTMLQQQQQALQQQQEAMKQQQAMMQQQFLQPSSIPGLGLSYSLGATPGSSSGLGGSNFGGMSSGNTWLENKVHQLENEKSQLESSIQFLEKHHKQQLDTVETNHQSYIALLEEGAKKRENRIKEDSQESAKRYEERLESIIVERSKVIGEHQARIEQMYTEHGKEMKTLKQIHKQEMEELRVQSRFEVEETRKAMQCHVDSLKDSSNHARSLKDVVERVGLVGDQINSLQGRVSDEHQFQLDNRLQELKDREEEAKRIKKRLEEQEATMSLERERLQATISRLEAHIKEQNIQMDQDRWRLRQEQNKLSNNQKMMEEERKVMSDHLAAEQTSLQQAKNAVLNEQKTLMEQCMEERKALASERAQFATTRREWEAKMKEQSTKASQEQATREGTLESLSAERIQISLNRESLHKEQNDLELRRQELEKEQEELQKEKARLQRLGDSLQTRSRELQGMVSDAVRVKEEGEAALVKARKIEGQHIARKQALEHQLEELRVTERKIAEDRVQIAENQRSLEISAGSLLCKQCASSLSMQNIHLPRHTPSNPIPMMMSSAGPGFMMSSHYPGSEVMPSNMADSLLNKAEHDRTVNVWKLAAEKDKEFLEEETSYLESLNNSYRVPAVI
ncbi:fas-binding factor 1 homolog [Lytechinus variegatus]|uniref:fas-binding factor 1 homolog n=1 Tax=Lytechinus variegatus TaxID=7654 RepID=UPI001BB13BDD|nr:fas-binding factor 1 homolog [Lytechinus variegatus]XP_041473315.1 fas-binding factor 1 homolog [Lytechinus variegatus]XP_041473316.1 fas-binding factor 1 homolog [Lytechinus variegatus]